MLGSNNGAQVASPHTRVRSRGLLLVGFALAGSLVGTLAAAPAAAAATSSQAKTSTAVALTTTALNKPWYTTERFYLGLVNCTRTGGWVLSNGTCRGYGSGRYSRYVAPFVYSYGLSDRVARPYAKLLAVRNLCSHYANGDPGYRFRKVGYTRWTWGENIGCGNGYATAKASVLASHLRFQAEKAANGGHWRNIKNAKFRSIGIGIWKYGSRTRLVTNFYG